MRKLTTFSARRFVINCTLEVTISHATVSERKQRYSRIDYDDDNGDDYDDNVTKGMQFLLTTPVLSSNISFVSTR